MHKETTDRAAVESSASRVSDRRSRAPDDPAFLSAVALYTGLYGGIAALIIFLGISLFRYQEARVAREQVEHAELVRLSLVEHVVMNELREVVADLRQLSHAQAVEEYVASPSATHRMAVERLFVHAAADARRYDQIRILGPNGQERVRVNYRYGVPQVVPDTELQDKTSRYYFKPAIRTPGGRIYVSPLDLNVEIHAIEQPPTPVMRVATRLEDSNGRVRGLLMLNYLAEILLARYADMVASSAGEAMLLDAEGYWLYSADKKNQWGFTLPHGQRFGDRYPAAWSAISSGGDGSLTTSEGTFAYQTIRPYPDAQYAWKAVTRLPSFPGYSPITDLRQQSAGLVTIVLVVSALLGATLAMLRTLNVFKQRALRESEQNLSEAESIAQVGNWRWNIQTNLVQWSDEAFRIFGILPRSITPDYEAFLQRVHADDRERVARAVHAALSADSPYAVEHRVIRSDGAERTVYSRGKVERNEAGQPTHMMGTIQDVTEQKQAEDRLRASEERLRLIAETIEDVFWMTTPGITKVLYISPAYEKFFGQSRARLYADPRSFLDSTHPEDRPRIQAALAEHARGIWSHEYRVLRPDGSVRWIKTRGFPIRDEKGAVRFMAGIVTDITDRKRVEEELRLNATVFGSANEAIVIADGDQRILAVNQAYTDITGYSGSDMVGQQMGLLCTDSGDETVEQSIRSSLRMSGQWQGEVLHRRKNHEVYPAWQNVSVVKDAEGRISRYVCIFSDISAMKEAEEKLRHLALHDALTDLPNRLLFSANLEQALEEAKRRKQRAALLFIDLDQFKRINDTLGHSSGDQLLAIVAERLRQCVRAEDSVARLSGDEFTVILNEVANGEDAAKLARKILAALSVPVSLGGHDVTIAASIGISVFPDDGKDNENLAKAADAALYRAKERGRNTYEFYTPELTTRALEHLSIEQSLRLALARGDFLVYYQKQVAIATNEVIGVEALVRWNHPTLGLLEPGQFIDVAEDSGLIEAIGEWVMRRACEQAISWHDAGMSNLHVSVNVSGRQLMRAGFAEHMEAILRETKLHPNGVALELEVTERALEQFDNARQLLQRVKGFGVTLALDDFGIGHSSLGRLRDLPIDTLKIDRSFMADVPGDPEAEAMVKAVIALGEGLGCRVVAEGVETQAQHEFLREQGCRYGQGNLYGPPLPAEHALQAPAETPRSLTVND